MTTWRTIAGLAVLAVLLLFAAFLIPPYIENWKLQQYLNEVSADAGTAQKSPEVVQANILDKAGKLGLPVHGDDVHVTKSGDAIRIEVLYVVHVNLSVYTVDLHFRPAA